jgi:hypothetical protein
MYRPSKSFEQEPWTTLAWVVPVCLLAAGTFFLAYDNGSYGVSQRETLAALVWWTLAIGALVGLLPRANPPGLAWATGILLTVFGIFTAASAFWASSAEKAFEEGNRVWLLAGIYFLVVFLSPLGSALIWVRGLGLGVTAVGGLALISRLYPHLFSETAQTAALFASAGKRLSFPVGYWNGLATLIALGVPLLLALAVAERGPIVRGLWLVPIPALVGVVYLTSSRGGSLALVLAALIFLVLSGRFLSACGAALVGAAGAAGVVAVLHARPELVNTPLESAIAESQGRSATLWVGLICVGTGVLYGALTAFGPKAPPLPRALGWIGAVIFVLVAALAIAAAHPGKRFEEFKAVPSDLGSESIQQHLLSSTSNGRWQLWQTAADEFKDHPAVGGGAGSYEAEWAEHGSLKLFVRDAHSLYIETLGELGIVGLTLLLATIGVGLVATLRRLFSSVEGMRPLLSGLVAAFVAFLFEAGFDWMWELTAVSGLAFAALAVATGPAADDTHTAPLETRPGWSFRAPAFFIGAVFLTAALCLLLANREVVRSQSAAAAGDTRSAIEHANAARKLEPWAASPWLQLALAREQAGDLEAAHDAILEAIDRDDSDWRTWLVAARLETKLGRFDEAKQSFDQARRLNPRSSLFASG